MRKVIAATSVAIGLLVGSAPASAQAPVVAERDHVFVSAERMFGFVHTEQTVTNIAGADVTSSQDNFSLFAGPLGAVTGYGFPRIGVDFVVGSHATVGGSLGFFHISSGQSSANGFLLAPRAGYMLTLGPRLQFWPRGGFTLQRRSGETFTTTTAATFYALTLEAPVVILFPPRVALLLGPTLDLGLGGTTTIGNTDRDAKVTDVAFHVGLAVVF